MSFDLAEPISRINYYLERDFGRELDGLPRWRVVWSEDQIEKRIVDTTDEGFQLLTPIVKEVKKYQYIKERYILERLVPVVGQTDVAAQWSYEPAWAFQDRHRNYLPPRFDACKFVIESIYAQADKKGTHVKYKDETATIEHREKLIREMQDRLFGNETPVGDALAHGYGVSMSGPKLGESNG